MSDLFPTDAAPKPPGWRRPGDRDHVCRECQGLAVYGLGDAWFCRAHVPAGFLPHLWGPRPDGPSVCVRCDAVKDTPEANQLCEGPKRD